MFCSKNKASFFFKKALFWLGGGREVAKSTKLGVFRRRRNKYVSFTQREVYSFV